VLVESFCGEASAGNAAPKKKTFRASPSRCMMNVERKEEESSRKQWDHRRLGATTLPETKLFSRLQKESEIEDNEVRQSLNTALFVMELLHHMISCALYAIVISYEPFPTDETGIAR